MSWTFLGSETISSSGTSTYALTLPTSVGNVQMIEMQPTGGPAYVTFDGSAPSSVAGMALSTGNGFYRFNHNAIEDTKIVFDSTSCAVSVNYYG